VLYDVLIVTLYDNIIWELVTFFNMIVCFKGSPRTYIKGLKVQFLLYRLTDNLIYCLYCHAVNIYVPLAVPFVYITDIMISN